MANWNRVASNNTSGNVPLDIDVGIESVQRLDNNHVRVKYGVRFKQSGGKYTYNSIGAFCPKGGERFLAFKNGSRTQANTWYYANRGNSTSTSEQCPFEITLNVGVYDTEASFEVGFGWNAHSPTQVGSASCKVYFPIGIYAPRNLGISVEWVNEVETKLKGYCNDNGNTQILETGYEYYRNNKWNRNADGLIENLEPNTEYKCRYFARNEVGTSYSNEIVVKTYDYPKCIGGNAFTINGHDIQINISNPLNRNYTVELVSKDQMVTRIQSNVNGIIPYQLFETEDNMRMLYNNIPNDFMANYYVKVIFNGNARYYNNSELKYFCNRVEASPFFNENNIYEVHDTSPFKNITGDDKVFIKGHNIVAFKIKPMLGNKGAKVDKGMYQIGGLDDNIPYEPNVIEKSISNYSYDSLQIFAYDNRSSNIIIYKKLNMIDYNKPIVSSAKIKRENGVGDHAIIELNGTYTNINNNNKIVQIEYAYKSKDDSNFSQWNNINANITYENNTWKINSILNSSFLTTETYDIKFRITDKIDSNISNSYKINTADVYVWKDLNNKKIGINKKPEYDFDINGSLGCKTFYTDTINNKNTNSSNVLTWNNGKIEYRTINTDLNDIGTFGMNDSSNHLDYNNTDRRRHLITAENLAFWNGSYDGWNSNLIMGKYGKVQFRPHNCFFNGNGSNAKTINLSKDISQCKKIVIYYRDSEWNYDSTEIINPVNKKICLQMTSPSNGRRTMKLSSTIYKIFNNRLELVESGASYMNGTNNYYLVNEIYIYQIDWWTNNEYSY